MGIFRQFPYSNFHEMNLDEILKLMRELQEEWDATKTEWNSYKEFIDNYFANLDVTQEVLNAMRVFASDGTLNTIIDPVIATATATWLAEHITVTTGETVIDSSLSIAGAAADAKATGDAINKVNSKLDSTELISENVGYAIALAGGRWGAVGAGVYNKCVPVTSGDVAHIQANSTHACYFTFLKSLNGMTTGAVADFATGYTGLLGVGVGNTMDFTAPSDAKYFYVFTSDANFIPSVLEINGYNPLISARDNFSNMFDEIENLNEKTDYLADNDIVNAFDPDSIINGYIIDYTNGQPLSNQYTANYAITDFIPVEFGDIVHMAFVRGTDLCGGALYDADRNFIKPIWGTEDFKKPATNIDTDFKFIIDDRNVSFIRYNIQSDNVFSKKNQYLWITPNKTYQKLNNTFFVGANRFFKTLKSITEYITNNGIENATVYVDAGTYDLVNEYGQEYLDNIVQTQNYGIGLHIGNGTHIIFHEGAKVKFLYNGTNTAVCEFFSPFNITSSCIIENADIEVSNGRYCVHEDLPTSVPYGTPIPSQCIVKYINCNMRHNGNTSGSYTGTVCIGGGCVPNGLSIIEGGKYTCGTQYPRAISYHNYNTTTYGNHPSRVILHNVWINNALRLGVFADSVVDVEISGCYIPNGIFGYSGTSPYFNVTQWNNIGIN